MAHLGFQRAVEAQLRTRAFRRAMWISISLSRYHARHGRFPAALEDLAPEFMPAAPLDPYVEAPFGYFVEPDGSACRLRGSWEDG